MKHLITAIVLMAITSTVQAGPFDWLIGKKKEKTNETIFTDVVGGDARTIVLTGEEYVEARKIEVIEAARGKCFESNGAMPTDPTAQSLREMRLATGGALDCGAGYADSLVAKEERKLGQTQARWSAGASLGKAVVGAVVTGVGIDRGAEVLTAGINSLGNRPPTTQIEINPNDESSVNVTGNIGEGNAFEQNGIITEPAPINPITFSGDSSEPETETELFDPEADLAQLCSSNDFDFIVEENRCSNRIGGTVIFEEDGSFTII